ncbi:MAG TPA: DUF1565 domain-containing protein [Abditibacteriaceae bacterium]
MITTGALRLTMVGLAVVGAFASPLRAANWYVDNGRGRGGNDNNAGTSVARPFRTIGKAAAVAKAGDTVLVRTGTYRETIVPRNSGRAGAPIVFQPYRDEAVTLSGAQRITGWELVDNNVYRAPMPWNFTSDFQSNQVFVNERMVHLARWPNNRGTLTRPTDAKAMSAADAGEGKVTFTMDDSFNEPDGRWNGAQVWVNLSLNQDGQGQTGTVVSTNNEANTITVSGIDNRTFNEGKNNPDQPWGIGAGTELYLFNPTLAGLVASGGVEQALDHGEWWYDEASRQLYLKTPDGSTPDIHAVEAKRRSYAFNLSGKSYITVRGFRLLGASITTDIGAAARTNSVAPAHHIVLDRLNAQYLTHFTDQSGNFQMQWLQKSGIILSGSHNTLQRSHLRYSAGPGVSVIGRNNRVLGNTIRDCNYSSSEAGALDTGRTYAPSPQTTSLDHEIGYNTLFDSPQQGMNIRALTNSNPNKRGVARVHHNLIHDVMLRTHDSGAIDQFGTDAQWVRIDHNVIYNMPQFLHIGIYLDFGTRYIIDHNVIYNVERPIQINWKDPNKRVEALVFNNTCLTSNPQHVKSIWNGFNEPNPGTVVRNNISLGGVRFGAGSVTSHNIDAESAMFINSDTTDMAARNYALKPTATAAINKGVNVAPWNGALIGLPDIGAYEYGSPHWQAGAAYVAALTAMNRTADRRAAQLYYNQTFKWRHAPYQQLKQPNPALGQAQPLQKAPRPNARTGTKLLKP